MVLDIDSGSHFAQMILCFKSLLKDKNSFPSKNEMKNPDGESGFFPLT